MGWFFRYNKSPYGNTIRAIETGFLLLPALLQLIIFTDDVDKFAEETAGGESEAES